MHLPPAGEGVDRGEAAPIGATIDVEGLAYTPHITRQLNPTSSPIRHCWADATRNASGSWATR